MKNQLIPFLITLASAPISLADQVVGDSANVGSGNNSPGANSAVIGENNSAQLDSISVGNNNSASDYSAAFGYSNIAKFASLAGGYSCTTDDQCWESITYGDSNKIRAAGAVAVFGTSNRINQTFESNFWTGGYEYYSIIAGESNAIIQSEGSYGSSNALIGSSNVISTLESGSDTFIQGSILLGANNKTSHSLAWTIGLGNIAQSETLTVGTYASEVSNASFIVGTGTGSGSTPRTNGLVVLKNGTVSIPSGVLQLGSESALTASSSVPVMSSYLSANNYLRKTMGSGAYASSSAILSVGNMAQATGEGSLAFGDYAQASGAQALSIGMNSKASAWASLALGGNASAYQSMAIGSGSNTSAGSSLAIGYCSATTSIALAGTALGFYAKANNGYATAIGNHTISNGWNSTAIGCFSISDGQNSTSIGSATSSKTAFSVALGSANLGDTGDSSNWIESDPVFELGNGNDTDNRSNAITTLKNGQTTLINKAWKNRATAVSATDDPTPEATDSEGEALVVDGHTRLRGKVVIEQAQGDISMGIYGN